MAGLRIGHQPLNARQRGVVADGGDPNTERRVRRYRAGYDSVAGALGDRFGLAGDHRLVEFRLAVDDPAVGRYPPAGSHQNHVADLQLVDPHRAHIVAVEDLGVVGQQFGQRGEGATGLADRFHLLPVTEQHDRHQRRQLPPELQDQPIEAGRHRRHVGDRDGHRDQQHHPRLAIAELGDTAGEERPATPPEHDRAEHRPEPRHPSEVELVTEPLHHHLAGHDQRNRQRQTHPEPAAEHLRVMPGVLVMAVPAIGAVAGVLRRRPVFAHGAVHHTVGDVVQARDRCVVLLVHADLLLHSQVYPLWVYRAGSLAVRQLPRQRRTRRPNCSTESHARTRIAAVPNGMTRRGGAEASRAPPGTVGSGCSARGRGRRH